MRKEGAWLPVILLHIISFVIPPEPIVPSKFYMLIRHFLLFIYIMNINSLYRTLAEYIDYF